MKLARLNNLLLVLIIALNMYVLLAPFTPRLVYWWQSSHGRKQQLTALITPSGTPKNAPSGSSKPQAVTGDQPNHIVIPSMLLDSPIYEGSIADTYKTLDKGIWHWPNGSSPDKGGNTVLLGHRFTYTKPQGVLYFLNKVAIGDTIGLTWNNKLYVYKVADVKVVGPSDTSILQVTADSRLTIYTCTPLWQPKQRLAVIAELET